ncbi:MobQ family relaxase [Phreatobacter sp. HK31-P]
MAIFHFSAQILGRGQGRKNLDGSPRKKADNAVAAAAYRAGEKLRDEGKGETHDYSNRAGVVHWEIIVPEGAPAWLGNREGLWSTVEQMETRKDAQLAREINIALPHELTREQQRELVQSFVRQQFVSLGMVADFAIHEPVREKGDDPRNVHAHIMLTLRRATPQGLDLVKTRAWNSRQALDHWREMWALTANRALRDAGRNERIDHRTLIDQRDAAKAKGDLAAAMELDRAPEIHVGPRPKAMQERKVVPVSRPEQRGQRRAGRPPSQRQASPILLQPGPSAGMSLPEWRDPDRVAFAEARLAAAKERWARKKAWEERQREWRLEQERRANERRLRRQLKEEREQEWAERQADRERERRMQAARRPMVPRVRDYPGTDQGTRIGWLWQILAGNNAKLKADLARIDARSARLQQWMDYYEQRATWWAEGKIGGAGHRYKRWREAQDARERREVERRQAERAKARAAQLKSLVNQLSRAMALLSFRQERGIQRMRQLERGWGQGREMARDRDRSRQR